MKPAVLNPRCENCVFRKLPGFAHVSGEVWERFEKLRTTHTYYKGNILFYEGNRPLGMFFLCSGRVKILKSDTGNRFHITRIVEAPDLLGDRAFIAQEAYTGTGEVMEESRVCFLEARYFKELFMKDPEVGFALARRFACQLGEAEAKMLDLALKTIRERLAKHLLERLRPSPGKSQLIRISESRMELAEILGTSPEAVSRTLGEFRDKGYIAVETHAIKVLDENRLRQIARLPSGSLISS